MGKEMLTETAKMIDKDRLFILLFFNNIGRMGKAEEPI
jgi:hypothetical protein